MNNQAKVKVWDPFVRFFHWTLVAAFVIAYATEDELITLHVLAGYTILVLLALRIVWGFIGPRYARFSDFVHAPGVVTSYIGTALRLRARRYIGHNPAGGAMIVAMIVSLLLTSISGLAVYGIEEQAGPMAPWVSGWGESWYEFFEEIHEFLANFSILLIVIHVAGVLFESLIHGENLVRAMFDGYKRAADKSDSMQAGSHHSPGETAK